MSLVANLIVSVCEDSLVTDETIGTVQENLFKLKETAVNRHCIYLKYSEEKFIKVVNKSEMVLRFPEPSTNANKSKT